MPTYTYRCVNCGHEFEARQRMTDDPLTECPECKGKVRRVVNSVGVVFKGKGFYVTDNRGQKVLPASSTNDKKDGSSSESTSSDSSESKSSSSSESTSSKTEKSSSPA